VDDLPRHFDLARTSHSAARFDEAQLRHWQREAITHASNDEIERWLGARLDALAPGAPRQAFVAAVRGNLLFPGDADELVAVVTRDRIDVTPDAAAQIVDAGADFFARAHELYATTSGDFKAWTRAIGEATARKGAKLFMPLRSALTGATHGPELAPLVTLMGAERVQRRLADARASAGTC
jgi:glutamyl-tRNA synthetase